MELDFIGHHGTDSATAKTIVQSNYFTFSHGEDEWLGYGIYFFNRSPFYAQWWAKDYKKYDPYSIIEVEIKVHKDNILDLTLPEGLDVLEKCYSKLAARKRSAKSFASTVINDKIVINYIYNNVVKFDLAIGIFKHTSIKYTTLQTYRSRLEPYQIQLCVRNLDSIKKIRKLP
ncbi:MAG: hypothetical protein WA118_13605 [Carboxydocellales bacterium]